MRRELRATGSPTSTSDIVFKPHKMSQNKPYFFRISDRTAYSPQLLMRCIQALFSGFFILFVLMPGSLFAQDPDTPVAISQIAPNYRIYPSQVTQTEVFIVRSPMDQDLLFSSCNTLTFIPFFVSEGIFVSTDAGTTWRGNDTCTGAPVEFHGGDPGITIDQNGRFILTRLGRSPFTGLYSHYSDDQGVTWSSQQVISTDDLERATLICDVDASSSFYGRTYAAWVTFAPPFPLTFSYTDDGAGSWSAPVAVNNPPNRSAGGDFAMGPGGTVCVCWAGVTNVTPFKEIHVGFASSQTGGATWTIQEQAFPVNGITGILPNKGNIRVNGLPDMAIDLTNGPRFGWIYIVTGQKDLAPAGSDPDVILNVSTDGGLTWSEGIRVNQDALNNGKDQYFPSVHVDRFGGVNVLFYDDRNTTTDSTGVYIARSTDGGATWNEHPLSDHHFKPVPIGGLGQGYQGDNIDLTSIDSVIYPVWMDNSTGLYQIWTAPVTLSAIEGVEELDLQAHGILSWQVFPNPVFRYGSSRLKVVSKAGRKIGLRVFDLQGREYTGIEPAFYPAGSHILEWHPGKDLPTGICCFSLVVDGRIVDVQHVILDRQ